MTDPLSITVGILAILGACSTGVKSLRSAHVSLEEYKRLEIELKHLHDVIKVVDGLLTEHHLTDNALAKDLTLARNQNQLKLPHNHLAQIYYELRENRAQIQHLTQKLAIDEANDRRLLSTDLKDEFEPCHRYIDEVQDVAEASEDYASDSTDGFDDCVSHFSEDNSHTLVDRLHTHFNHRMSPDDFFETPLTFVGEKYTVETRLGEPAAVVAMTEIDHSSIHRLQKYFLIYAEAPRLWRRVTISAMILRSSQFSVYSEVAAPDIILSSHKTLPGNLQHQLQGLLKSLALLETVTKISLTIAEHFAGNYTINIPSVAVSEDLDESYINHEKDILQDIQHMDVPQYLQSEVIVQERMDAVTYLAQVESRPCMERKIPFSGGGLPGDNGLKRFWQDLKLTRSLYACNGVVQFMGVVLDDTKTHVKSFLQELPALGTIRSILAHAELRQEPIPWSVRATWASQIISAVAEIHSKGFVVGLLHINFTNVRSDGRAVLNLRKRGYNYSINRDGEIAQESRHVPNHSIQPRKLDFCSDIFMLGMLLWQIAEHRSNIGGYLCLRNACTSVPRHSCNAEHINPVELPPCIDKEVPQSFNLLISLCRKADPRKRPPARTLLQYIDPKSQPSNIAELQKKYTNTHSFLVCCAECGTVVDSNAWYHCNICHFADFDLCSPCVSQGVRCFDKKHQLVKRIFKNGSVTNVL
ncbi:MAG: hypothetical protein Q9167_007659 [Letrouitia subvulpina]